MGSLFRSELCPLVGPKLGKASDTHHRCMNFVCIRRLQERTTLYHP
jgi:hypothetical protein